MEYIGGFFELEVPRGRNHWHPRALALSTGRACLTAILEHVKPARVRIPFYACDAILDPMQKAGIPVEFYALDERLRPVDLAPQRSGELLVAINYFGLQSDLMETLARRFERNFVADNIQAFFERGYSGSWAMCSARKFFGVRDGAYLYAPEAMNLKPLRNQKSDIRYLVNRLSGRQQTGHRQCQRREKEEDSRIRAMSVLSERLLSAVDYRWVKQRRRKNYRALHALLGEENLYQADLPAGAVPFCYPLLLPAPVDRAALARENLYVPTLWPEVVQRRGRGFSFERRFTAHMLPLPVDHRYEVEHMREAVRRLRNVIGSAS